MFRPKSLFTVALVALVLCGARPATAAFIFDNYKGSGAPQYTEETRSATGTFGTVLNSTTTTTIDRIEFRWRPNNDMDVTFLIFDSQLAGTRGSVNWSPIGNNVLFSQTKHVLGVVGPVDYYLSTDPFTFTFQANHRYDIGILGSNGTLTGSWDIQNGTNNINTIQGGFESINNNANLFFGPGPRSNFGYAGVDPHIRIHAADVNAVPAPAGLLLGLTGLPALGLAGWVRRRRAAVGV